MVTAHPNVTLVLGGGSIKGAFQAGAIEVAFSRGFTPEAMFGISAGSLNVAYLAHHAGQQQLKLGQVDWAELGKELTNFWIKYVTAPDRLITERPDKGILFTNPDQGMYDNSPLRERLNTFLHSKENFLACPVPYAFGAVNLLSGEIEYVGTDEFNRYPSDQLEAYIYDRILASTAIPLVMPLMTIGGQLYCDGGVIDVVPVEQANKSNPTRIICVACQPERTPYGNFNKKNLVGVIERFTGIMADETIRNDLGGLDEKTRGDILIRPKKLIEYEINDFNTRDIEEMVNLGRDAAHEKLDAVA